MAVGRSLLRKCKTICVCNHVGGKCNNKTLAGCVCFLYLLRWLLFVVVSLGCWHHDDGCDDENDSDAGDSGGSYVAACMIYSIKYHGQ